MKSSLPYLPVLSVTLFLISAGGTLHAADFKIGEASARFDLSVSVGGLYRLKDPSPQLIGLASGGEQFSVNADDGNLNYSKGLVSLPAIATADLEIRDRDWGLFFRANAFYDYINENRERERTPLTSEAMDRVGSRIDVLDAYFWLDFDIGAAPANLRLGRQVLNWGESTFIQNGVGVINPVDVSKIRLPGGELREAFLPVWMASASVAATDNITLEAFYQFRWKEVIIDPPGTYFSNNDFVGRGGNRVYLGFGQLNDQEALGAIPRGPDNRPRNSGQFGIASRIFAPALNQSEFGLFFIQYHSRLPVISARTPTDPISPTVVQATASNLAQQNLAPAMIANNIPPETVAAVLPQLIGAALTEVPADSLPPTLAPFAPFYPAAQQIAQGARQVGFLTSAATGRYLIEYPESIKVVGLSYNTDLANTGIALQGELTYRWDQPLQVDDVELLFSALSSINPAFGQLNQLGNLAGQLDTYVRGWSRERVWQLQTTATKVFGQALGADQMILLAEVGVTHVPSLPSKSELRYDAPGTFSGGNPQATAAGVQPITEPAQAFADRTSWGYRLVCRLNYLNAFMSMNVSPHLQFAHDVSGNTPLPLGNFQRNRKITTLGLDFSYQNSWSLDLNYTTYSGGGRYNLSRDRDFFSVTTRYSF